MLSISCSASLETKSRFPPQRTLLLVLPSPPLSLRSSFFLYSLSISLSVSLSLSLHSLTLSIHVPHLSSCPSLTGPCLRGVYVRRLSPSAAFRSAPWRTHVIPALSLLFDTPTIVNLTGRPSSARHERRSQSLPVAGRPPNC